MKGLMQFFAALTLTLVVSIPVCLLLAIWTDDHQAWALTAATAIVGVIVSFILFGGTKKAHDQIEAKKTPRATAEDVR